MFSLQAKGDFGVYLVWLSHPPPVLIPAHAMKQNTGDMSGSKALSGCQKHLPKYLHLLLLFIHHQCGDLLLVFGDDPLSQTPLVSEKVKKKIHNTFSLFVFQGIVDSIRHLLILCLSGNSGDVYHDLSVVDMNNHCHTHTENHTDRKPCHACADSLRSITRPNTV